MGIPLSEWLFALAYVGFGMLVKRPVAGRCLARGAAPLRQGEHLDQAHACPERDGENVADRDLLARLGHARPIAAEVASCGQFRSESAGSHETQRAEQPVDSHPERLLAHQPGQRGERIVRGRFLGFRLVVPAPWRTTPLLLFLAQALRAPFPQIGTRRAESALR